MPVHLWSLQQLLGSGTGVFQVNQSSLFRVTKYCICL